MKTNKITVRTDKFTCTIDFGEVMDLPKEKFIELAQNSYICQNTIVLDVADANTYNESQRGAMTLEELQAEAKKHGYKLVKDTPYVRLSPCVCGHKGHGQYADWSNKKAPHYLKCYRCGFASEPAKTKYEAKLKWNECVENARKEKNNDKL